MMTPKERQKPMMVTSSIIERRTVCAGRDTPRNTKQALRPPVRYQYVLYRQSIEIKKPTLNERKFEAKNLILYLEV